MASFILSDGEIERIKLTNPDLTIESSFYPTTFQTSVLLRKEKEIALLGGKFGGKSVAARLFLIKGNPYLRDYSPSGEVIWVNKSYIYHPNYYATILRRNQVDLDEFLIRAATL